MAVCGERTKGDVICECLVLLSSFFIILVTDFLVFTYGLLMLELQDAFGVDKGKLLLTGSVFVGSCMLVGPIVSILLDRWSCRPVIIVGTLVAVVGFIIASFSVNVEMLILTYGALAGSAVGIVYITGIVMVGLRFTRHRALATGIALSGSGAGVLTMSYPLERILTEYGWRGTVLLTAGLFLNCCVFGALIFPPRRNSGKATKENGHPEMEDANASKNNGISGAPPSLDLKIESHSSGLKRPGGTSKQNGHHINVSEEFPAQPFPSRTSHLVHLHNSPRLSESELSNSLPNHNGHFLASQDHDEEAERLFKQSKISDISINAKPKAFQENGTTYETCEKPMAKESVKHIKLYPRVSSLSCTDTLLNRSAPMFTNKPGLVNSGDSAHHRLLHGHKDKTKETGNGNVSHVWRSEPTLFSYAFASRLTIEIEMDKSPNFTESSEGKQKTWLRRHIDLAQNLQFLMILLVMGLYTGFISILVFLPDLAVSRGISRTEASLLISGYGIANIIGRILSGALSNHKRVDSTVVYAGALFLLAVDVILLLQCQTFAHFMAGSVVFGLCCATCMSLRTIVVADVLGVELLTAAFGVICVVQGVCYIVLPPICGSLFTTSGSFHSSFYLIAAMNGIAGVVCTLLRPVQKWQSACTEAKEFQQQRL